MTAPQGALRPGMSKSRGAGGVRRRAVVTGAAGFIGSHLCERLVTEGWRVVGVDRFTDYYPQADKQANLAALVGEPRFDLVEADLAGDGWQEALEPQDTVFHLAAQAGVRGSYGKSFGRYARDNVLATQRVFEAAEGAGCRRVVWASSSSVYGDSPSYPCREDAVLRPRSPYGVTKRACEDLAQVYRDGGLPVTGLRYFTVFGPRQRPDMALRRICEALVQRRPFTLYGDGFQSRDFTYVLDACEATYRAALVADPAPLYNVGGGQEATLLQIVAVLERLLGAELELHRVGVQRGDVRRTKADVTLAGRSLGWRPVVGLEQGLANQLRWVRSRHERRSVA
jgi:UDP-glucuronate 4-epimerase